MSLVRTKETRVCIAMTAAVIAVLAISPATAHHVMDGELPSTFTQGLLSGLGHPVIGLDHLAFIVALGIAAAVVPGPLAVIATFVALSAAGVLIHIAKLDVPMVEPLVALTVLLAGAALVWSRSVTRPMWVALAAVAGLLHGYAFGESIVGAERTVLGAYIVGIALITALIATMVMTIARKVVVPDGIPSPSLKIAGAALGCVGAALLAVTLMPG
ncbi:MAG: HupE/UreJ family protein [Hyphomicrobiaceae bacterium]